MLEAAVLMLLTLRLLQLLKEFARHSQTCLSSVIFASVLTLIMDIVVGELLLFYYLSIMMKVSVRSQ